MKILDKEKEKREWENVLHLQKLNPGFSTCKKCGLPWSECESKSINITKNNGVFAMCKYCWNTSDLEERLHHFKSVWYDHKNRSEYNYDWSVVEENIRFESLEF